jgi:osmotically-inducible protein OsmY
MKRKISSGLVTAFFGSALLLPGSLLLAQTAPDNTSVNKQDRNEAAPNADTAKTNTSDTELMAHIRREVVKDKSLSTYAHNVKIVSRHGKVTLRGPVHTQQEKDTIEQYAKKYAGDGNVTDDITVKSDAK